MGDSTSFRGPVNSEGALMDSTVSEFDGPSIFYQGSAFPDPRYLWNKDGVQPGRVYAFGNSVDIVLIDQIPMIASTTTIAAVQVATSAVAMALTTTAAGGSAAGVPSAAYVPIIPFGATNATSVLALDFGFTTGTTAANSSTVVVVDSSQLDLGQWIAIGGVGNAGLTAGLITQITSIANATTIKISPVAVGALSHAPIGQANAAGFNPTGLTATAAIPYQVTGLARMYDPLQGMTRCISVTGNTTNATAGVIISGYDIYGVAMTELITAVGTSTIFGKKAFKYILNAIPNATNSNSFTVGIGDTVGLPIRSDRWDNLKVNFANGLAVTSRGWLTAVTTVATNTTGDARGTIQLSPLGNGTSLATIGATSNATSRLFVTMSVPIYNFVNATPTSYTSLFGVTQA